MLGLDRVEVGIRKSMFRKSNRPRPSPRTFSLMPSSMKCFSALLKRTCGIGDHLLWKRIGLSDFQFSFACSIPRHEGKLGIFAVFHVESYSSTTIPKIFIKHHLPTAKRHKLPGLAPPLPTVLHCGRSTQFHKISKNLQEIFEQMKNKQGVDRIEECTFKVEEKKMFPKTCRIPKNSN